MKDEQDQSAKQSKSLTRERLIQFEGLAEISDDEEKQIIESLDQLSKIFFADWQNLFQPISVKTKTGRSENYLICPI